MNMKKTIAAVAACAVAVSAMATTVSAEEGSLHYNLVRQEITKSGSVSYTITISKLAITGADKVIIALDVPTAVAPDSLKWTVNGYTTDSNGTKTDSFNYVNYVPADHTWEANNSTYVATSWWNPLGGTFTLPVSAAGVQGDDFYATVTVTASHNDTTWGYKNLQATASVTVETAGTGVTSALVATPSGYSYPSTDKYPMMTSINTNNLADSDEVYYAALQASYKNKDGQTVTGKNFLGSFGNIITYLDDDDMNLISVDDGSYTNVLAVLNDVIANYEDVTFVFNTAADKVGKTEVDLEKDVKVYYEDPTTGALSTTQDATYTNEKKVEVTTKKAVNGYKYDGNGSDKYMKFNQHLYNLYGDENTGYVYSTAYDWNGYNLFNGALIVNGNLSMSLNDTNVFDYGATTLSFNWSDAISGANVNTFATYLSKLQLATSTMWFWDSMDVVYASGSDEDAASGEGEEAEEDTIGEDTDDAADDVVDDVDDAADDVVDDVDDAADDVDDAADDVDVAVDDTADVADETASNPGTGNAPIALAVIPVALAAAAVVAKKRG